MVFVGMAQRCPSSRWTQPCTWMQGLVNEAQTNSKTLGQALLALSGLREYTGQPCLVTQWADTQQMPLNGGQMGKSLANCSTMY